jgi:transcriptional regulator with XRE-family HTH domain
MLSKSELGERVRRARQARGMTLKEVAAVAHLSAPHICEIEQGKTSPTFGALARIALALGKPAAHFLEDEALPEVSVVRRGECIPDRLVAGGTGVAATAEPLTAGIPCSHLGVRRLLLEPQAGTSIHQGEVDEGGLVLQGRVEARVGDEVRMLEPGDATFFAAGELHELRNPGPAPAEILWIHLDRVTE